MDSRRQLKIASVIQEAFTEILAREGRSIYGNAFVTLTKVKVTSDLSLARFYLSVFNAENPDEVVWKFTDRKTEMKRKLSEKLRFQLRVMPEIEFFRDETLDYAFHMEEVFKKIKEEDDALKAEVEGVKPGVKAKKAAAKKKPATKRSKE